MMNGHIRGIKAHAIAVVIVSVLLVIVASIGINLLGKDELVLTGAMPTHSAMAEITGASTAQGCTDAGINLSTGKCDFFCTAPSVIQNGCHNKIPGSTAGNGITCNIAGNLGVIDVCNNGCQVVDSPEATFCSKNCWGVDAAVCDLVMPDSCSNKIGYICGLNSCILTPAPSENDASTCSDGIDNDCDKNTDCADSSCANKGPAENTQATCSDKKDNDCDGKIDCADPGCNGIFNGIFTCEYPERNCLDEFDNDGSGVADCYDTSCCTDSHTCKKNGVCYSICGAVDGCDSIPAGSCSATIGKSCSASCAETTPPAETLCDNKDDNCNRQVDEGLTKSCGLTKGVCAGATQKTCSAGIWSTCNYGSDYETKETRCDGLDNDCDGLVDEGGVCYTEYDCGTFGNNCLQSRGLNVNAVGCNNGQCAIKSCLNGYSPDPSGKFADGCVKQTKVCTNSVADCTDQQCGNGDGTCKFDNKCYTFYGANPVCAGKKIGDNIAYCGGGKSWFLDKCNEFCQPADRETTACSGAAADASCTADTDCHGVTAGKSLWPAYSITCGDQCTNICKAKAVNKNGACDSRCGGGSSVCDGTAPGSAIYQCSGDCGIGSGLGGGGVVGGGLVGGGLGHAVLTGNDIGIAPSSGGGSGGITPSFSSYNICNGFGNTALYDYCDTSCEPHDNSTVCRANPYCFAKSGCNGIPIGECSDFPYETCDSSCTATDVAFSETSCTDGKDNNCNGKTDTYDFGCCIDTDKDGWNATAGGVCGPIADCNDATNKVYPGATEVCDGKDNDCNSNTADSSGEVASNASNTKGVCAGQKRICSKGAWQDPDYTQTVVGYEANEITCNGIDDDCDGQTDENIIESQTCGIGICTGGAQTRTCAAGAFGAWSACSTDSRKTNEICNGLDDNCDGAIDETFDLDGDGYFSGAGCAQTYSILDCNDNNAGINPNPKTSEICIGGVDEDCNGLTDSTLEGCGVQASGGTSTGGGGGGGGGGGHYYPRNKSIVDEIIPTYRKGDGICDIGETPLNSPIDCKCMAGEILVGARCEIETIGVKAVCGNSIAEGAEVCDNSEDSQCPGACNADCTCKFLIGDGVCNKKFGEVRAVSPDDCNKNFSGAVQLGLIFTTLLGGIGGAWWMSRKKKDRLEDLSVEHGADAPLSVAPEEASGTLTSYINHSLSEGFNPVDIRATLISRGWSPEQVDKKLISAAKDIKFLSAATEVYKVQEPHDNLGKVEKYVNYALKEGYGPVQIKSALMANGWKEKTVEDVFAGHKKINTELKDMVKKAGAHKPFAGKQENIHKFVKAGLRAGHTPKKIKQALLSVGWKLDTISKHTKI